MDSIASVYSDTRSEYTKQLCIFLVPAYFQFFVDLLAKVKQGVEPKKVLWQFQTNLNEVHDWNMEKVHNEITLIQHNTGCDYLEDLLTAVFIAHTKVLTAIRISANNKKIEITVPKVEHFLFKVLCEVSKLLWSSTYLFREDISGIDRQQNYKLIEGIINEGIVQAIRSLVPVKSILKNLVNQDVSHDVRQNDDKTDNPEDSDDETSKPVESSVSEPPLQPSVSEPPLQPSVSEPPLQPSVSEPPLQPSVSESSLKSSLKSSITPSVEALPAIEPISLGGAIEPLEALTPDRTSTEQPIINLDEKPTVSFAKFNTFFGGNADESSIAESVEAPDLEIPDEGSSLTTDDFVELEESSQSLDEGDYDEL
jgi:hypothetical protein